MPRPKKRKDEPTQVTTPGLIERIEQSLKERAARSGQKHQNTQLQRLEEEERRKRRRNQ